MPIIKKDYGDTRYRPQVSRKYSGVTYGGQPAVPTRTPAGDLANALKTEATPFMEAYTKNYISDVSETATIKLNQLRMSGKSADNIHQEIMSGQHPELESMYAKSAIDGMDGRFRATDAINGLEKAKIEYQQGNWESQSFEEFVSQSGYLPDFSTMSSAESKGFATEFNPWFEKEKLADAIFRGKTAHNKKMSNISALLMSQIARKEVTTAAEINAILENSNPEFLNQYGEPDSFISNQDKKDILLRTAQQIGAGAETEAEIDIAIEMLIGNRGVGEDGTFRKSLLQQYGGDADGVVTTLFEQLKTKKQQLITRARTNEDYEMKQAVKTGTNALIEIYATTEAGKEREEKLDALYVEYREKGYGYLISDFRKLSAQENTVALDDDEIWQHITDGRFSADPDGLLQYFLDNNYNITDYTRAWNMIQEFDKHGGSPFNDDSSFNSAKALAYEDIKGQVGLVWNQIRKDSQLSPLDRGDYATYIQSAAETSFNRFMTYRMLEYETWVKVEGRKDNRKSKLMYYKELAQEWFGIVGKGGDINSQWGQWARDYIPRKHFILEGGQQPTVVDIDRLALSGDLYNVPDTQKADVYNKMLTRREELMREAGLGQEVVSAEEIENNKENLIPFKGAYYKGTGQGTLDGLSPEDRIRLGNIIQELNRLEELERIENQAEFTGDVVEAKTIMDTGDNTQQDIPAPDVLDYHSLGLTPAVRNVLSTVSKVPVPALTTKKVGRQTMTNQAKINQALDNAADDVISGLGDAARGTITALDAIVAAPTPENQPVIDMLANAAAMFGFADDTGVATPANILQFLKLLKKNLPAKRGGRSGR